MNNNKTIKKIINEIEKLEKTDFDINDFNISPENWNNEKVLFLISSTIDKFQLKNTTTNHLIKHIKIFYNLRSIGVTSVNISHSFSATYLGFTQEHFSWKFEVSKIENKNVDEAYLQQNIKNTGTKDKIINISVDDFYYPPIRISSIYDQSLHIVRLFKELYLGFKKVNINGSKSYSDKEIIDVVINLVPFILQDIEGISLNRQNSSIHSEKISDNSWKQENIKTTIKVGSLYKKPSINFISISDDYCFIPHSLRI